MNPFRTLWQQRGYLPWIFHTLYFNFHYLP